MKNREGISLIVLIITIIVVVILAAAIILSMSKSNPITNATKAVNENDFKTAQEAVVAWIGDRWISDTNNDGTAGDEVGALYSGTVTNADNSSVEVTLDEIQPYLVDLKLYELGLESLDQVIIKNNRVVKIVKGKYEYSGEEQSEDNVPGIGANQVKKDAVKYYGKNVEYVTRNGYNNWKVFYSDGNQIYLIAGDYVENSYLSNCGFSLFGSMGTHVSEVTSKKIESMLVSNEKFLDENGYGERSALAPTLDMFCNSWNDMYPDEKIYCLKDDSDGYYLGLNENPTTYYVNVSNKEGYMNPLYFPQKNHIGTWDLCFGYYLATKSIDYSDYVFSVMYDGRIISTASLYTYGNYTSTRSFRPVVVLDKNTKLVETESDNYKIVGKN